MPIAVIALISEVLAVAPQAIALGLDVSKLIGSARDALDANAAPTDAQWQALDQQVNDLRARLAADPA